MTSVRNNDDKVLTYQKSIYQLFLLLSSAIITLYFWQGVYMEPAGNLMLLFLFVFHSDLLILPNLEIG